MSETEGQSTGAASVGISQKVRISQKVTVACAQLAPVISDEPETLRRIEEAIRFSATAGAQIVLLPELAHCGYMFEGFSELSSVAQRVDGPYLRHLIALAAELQLIIVSGFAESSDDGAVYNSAAIIDATGVLALYRKAHLWNTEKTCGFSAGNEHPPIIDTMFGRLGLMICYDLEFPEWVRPVALAGAELLCAPVNWPLSARPNNERPGELVRVQADAAVNRMFIAIADRVGSERGQDWLGGSMIVDPDGYPVTSITLGEAHIALATIDLAEAQDKTISPQNDVHSDMRPLLYETPS